MTAPSDHRCEIAELVSLYALQALGADESAAVETHLADCAQCRGDLEALRPVVDSFVAWPTDVLRPATPLWERLSERIGAQPSGGDRAGDPWIEPEWVEVSPGISCKLFATDDEQDRVTMLVRLAPGVEYPPHRHAGTEELHLLDGELVIDDKLLRPGDYIRAEPGTADARVWSATGCTCLLITSPRDELR